MKKTVQIRPTERPVSLGECSAVLVKYNFTNPKYIPPGITRVDGRPQDGLIDREHAKVAKQAGQPELAAVGRYRPGRVDIGEKVWENIQQTSVSTLHQELITSGLRVGRFRWYIHRREGRQTKFVVELGLTRNPMVEVSLSDEQEKAFVALTTPVWSSHIWANSDGTCTINMAQRQPGQKPRHMIGIRDGNIIVMSIK